MTRPLAGERKIPVSLSLTETVAEALNKLGKDKSAIVEAILLDERNWLRLTDVTHPPLATPRRVKNTFGDLRGKFNKALDHAEAELIYEE